MPIYEYRCDSCGFQKEHLQKMSDPQLTTCPECGQESYSKLLSAAGFQLKGNGWYATDFKGGSKKAETPPPCQTGGLDGLHDAGVQAELGERNGRLGRGDVLGGGVGHSSDTVRRHPENRPHAFMNPLF